MTTPGLDHPITLEPAANRWRAQFAGHVIADSDDAVILREADSPPRVYFPRQDVAMEYMSRTERGSHCPYKGDAAYYTMLMDGQFAENAVWSYEQPFEGMEAIAGRLAFYPDKVEVYEVDDAAVNPRHREEPTAGESRAFNVDAVVQHTDAGAGTSQRPPWPANVEPLPSRDDGGLR
jgi:uncharacterized protein (DUF427 family)